MTSANIRKSSSSSSTLSVPALCKMFTKHFRRKSLNCHSWLNSNKNRSSYTTTTSSCNCRRITTTPSSIKISTFIVFVILSALVNKISAIGNFELEILEISNTNNHLLSGYCCGVPLEMRSTKTTGCPPCSTAFRLCLKEYSAAEQGTPRISTGCSFGNTTTGILGGSSFVLSDPVRGAMILPFTFRWTKSFTLILQALDMYNVSYPDSERLIEETSFSSVILPSPEWKTLDHIGRNARITYRVRVQCAATYYNTTCTTFCRSRNDRFGHYDCGPQGEKICLNGWTGDNCEKAICKLGCDPVHGKCDKPGECDCRPGWQGPLCNECVVYPGCKHGSCYGEAWKCKCDTNWGGILCDQDLNYCGTHEPCKHGGTCENTAPDRFRCTCAEGLSGERCEIIEHPCATQPCKNGGTCSIKESSSSATMRNSTAMPSSVASSSSSSYRVMRDLSSAMGKPVNRRNLPLLGLNSGSQLSSAALLSSILNSYGNGTSAMLTTTNESNYHNGYSHPSHHQQQQQQHQQIPPVSEFTCDCVPGWTGPTCEINIDECAGGPCEHGGTCIDLIGGFRCVCPAEWTGDVCQMDVNECEMSYPPPSQQKTGPASSSAVPHAGTSTAFASSSTSSSSSSSTALIAALATAAAVGNFTLSNNNNNMMGPCVNARQCINLPGSFSCVCLEGWGGPTCATDFDDCVGQCKNGATCRDLVNDYRCLCATGFTGRDCESDIDECANSPCRNGGECVDMIGKFNCICPLGYSGTLCEEANDHCTPSPCLEGRCLNTPGSYYCHCPPGRAGKHCEQIRPLCNQPHCNDGCFANSTVIDSSKNLPCSGHGTCEMVDVGTFCKCHAGYTGTFCEHNLNECSPNPCRNGGICLDGDGDFTCECPSGWTGKRCSERATACYPGQCKNGGSCVPGSPEKGLHSQCRCAPGWDGTYCTDPIDQCRGQPCHNGGTCESGSGWFRCVCARGFSGPDCRINVNECSPQPCEGGATCIDGIGGYSCICPPGRHGTRCEILLSDSKSSCINSSSATSSPYSSLNKSQDILSQLLTGQTSDYCNACICENGTSRCTNLWCGLENCFRTNATSKSSNFSGLCKQHEVCVPTLAENCLNGQCAFRGDCRAIEPSHRVEPPRLPAKPDCWPNQAVLNDNCARLSILLDRQRLGPGSSVEGLCSVLRFLLASRMVKLPKGDKEEGMLIVICDIKTGTNDTIEVTVSSTLANDSQLPTAISLLGELLSSRQTNDLPQKHELRSIKLAALVSILEVKVETALIAEGNSNNLLIGILCGIFIVLVGLAIFLSLFWRQRMGISPNSGIGMATSQDPLRHDEEKSNNLQNEENLRRYTNPLKVSTSSLARVNGMELSLNPSPEIIASVSPTTTATTSGVHSSRTVQPLYPESNFDCDLEASQKTKEFQTKRTSQILLHKTQNSDMKKNTVGSIDSPRKDFGKRSINCRAMPVQTPPVATVTPVPVATTTTATTAADDSEILTVLV
ncbi:protein serrate isoform X2 [Musca autumnalis]|uniref:protein serrate isoform X2 n=1 Tax=Musca autumnalis TaxID=221902 RepID=UPI003CF1355B